MKAVRQSPSPFAPPFRRPVRGVSLIEALVALTVMSFGMLAVVGVQGTLRFNSDVAKQRSEAVRIGQEAMESLRAYTQLQTDPSGTRQAFADIATAAATAVTGYTTNATYTLDRRVVDDAVTGLKSLQITVRWQDRNGAEQSIRLESHIARIEPALTAAVVNSGAYRQPALKPAARHVAIPLAAKDMGEGFSAMKLPSSGSTVSTTAWVFNNLTGYITGVCTVAAGATTASLTTVDIAACRNNTLAHLLSGWVRFFTEARQATATDAENPLSRALNLNISLTLADNTRQPSCFDDAPATTTAALLQTAVSYFCLIPANEARTWAGYSTVAPLAFTDTPSVTWTVPVRNLPADTAITHRVCRYTPATSDAQVVPNWLHPHQYRIEYTDATRLRVALPMPPLVNQNFLIILDGYNCPTDGVADPLRNDFVNSNTLLHNPLP